MGTNLGAHAALRGEPVESAYRTAPATDDSPYFHRFLPWGRLRESLAQTRGLGAASVDWGTIVVLVGALQVMVLGLLLVAAPVFAMRRTRAPPGTRRYAVLHFLAIGVAYALLEMAFLGRLTSSLGSPEYAAGAVLSAFLVGSGVGSFIGAPVRYGAWAAAVLGLVALPILGGVHSLWLAVPICAVVALPMGVPFPGGLRRVDARGPGLVPWSLAANGCASVAAFAFAPLLASDIGYSGMAVTAALLYAAVGLANRPSSVHGRG